MAPSIKKGALSPIASLSRKFRILFEYYEDLRFNQHIPNDDNAILNDEVIKDKLVISTHHQAKGLERPVVILFNFDSSYFKYYNTNVDPTKCPNELYVATTRTLERLSLIHDFNYDYLPFIKKSNIELYCEVIQKKTLSIKEKPYDNNSYDVTELVKHLPIELISITHDVLYKISPININNSAKIKMNSTSKQRFGTENVSDITGTAIPLYYAVTKFGKEELNITKIKLTKQNYNRDILKIANIMMCKRDCIDYKLAQIQKYDWLPKNILDMCVDRLDNLNLSGDGEFEKGIATEPRYETYHKEIVGCMDYQDDRQVFEFKCVEELEPAHFIQLAIYKYLNEVRNQMRRYYLFNILSNEMYELTSNHEDLKKMMELLVANRCFPVKNTNNEEFMANCLHYNFKNYI